MSYTVTKLAHEPIVHYQLGADYDLVRDSAAAEADVLAAVMSQDEPVYVIFDFSLVNLGIDDVIKGANMLVSGAELKRNSAPEQEPLFNQPNLIQVVMATESKIIRLAAKGMNSPIFGNQDIKLCETLEEAFEYVRSAVEESSVEAVISQA